MRPHKLTDPLETLGGLFLIAALLAVAGFAVPAPALAQNIDVKALRARLNVDTPIFPNGDGDPMDLELNDERLELEAHEEMAAQVAGDYASEHFGEWVRGTPLEHVEQLRRTGIELKPRMLPGAARISRLAGGGDSGGRTGGLRLSLRLSDEVRMRITNGHFTRDLYYDPLGRRMWMELYRIDLPGIRGGLAVTNTYRLDDESSDLLLRFNLR